jgi:hypothetical protein
MKKFEGILFFQVLDAFVRRVIYSSIKMQKLGGEEEGEK